MSARDWMVLCLLLNRSQKQRIVAEAVKKASFGLRASITKSLLPQAFTVARSAWLVPMQYSDRNRERERALPRGVAVLSSNTLSSMLT